MLVSAACYQTALGRKTLPSQGLLSLTELAIASHCELKERQEHAPWEDSAGAPLLAKVKVMGPWNRVCWVVVPTLTPRGTPNSSFNLQMLLGWQQGSQDWALPVGPYPEGLSRLTHPVQQAHPLRVDQLRGPTQTKPAVPAIASNVAPAWCLPLSKKSCLHHL